MKQNPTEILVLTRSVALQQGLGALLESLPGITEVKASSELPDGYAWIESHRPKIVFLDAAFVKDDPKVILGTLRTLSPQTQRVLLVDRVEEVQGMPQFAEAILIKGVAPAAVAAVVKNLLSMEGDEDEYHVSGK